MKAAISIADEILREADEAAQRMGLSRSRLFALAVADFLQRQKQEPILLRLNEVYADPTEPAEKRLAKDIKATVRGTVKDHG